jgi:Spy/CpxP family protein refolding chaperone
MKHRWMMIAISALMLIGLSAFAQEQQAPPPGQGGGQGRGGMMMSPEQRANRLAEQLSLSDDQKAKVQKIYEDAQKDMQSMQGASREDRMAKMQATNEKVKAVLNDDQKKKFDEMQQRMRDRQRQGGPGGEGGGQKPPSL